MGPEPFGPADEADRERENAPAPLGGADGNDGGSAVLAGL
jgi:hypothetical protein